MYTEHRENLEKHIIHKKMAPGISYRSHFLSAFMILWMDLECAAQYGPTPYKMV